MHANRVDEDEAVARARGGNADAFSELVLAYQGPTRAFCSRFNPDPDSADDAAQEVFLRAYQSLDRFEIGTDFGKWLRGVARNVLSDSLRRQAREARARKDFLRARVAERLAKRMVLGERGEDTDSLLAALSRCVEKLGERSQGLVRTHYERGVSAAEIARRLGRGLSAVRMELLRLRRALRRCVESERRGIPA